MARDRGGLRDLCSRRSALERLRRVSRTRGAAGVGGGATLEGRQSARAPFIARPTREVLDTAEGQPIVVLSHGAPRRTLFVLPAFVETEWISPAEGTGALPTALNSFFPSPATDTMAGRPPRGKLAKNRDVPVGSAVVEGGSTRPACRLKEISHSAAG